MKRPTFPSDLAEKFMLRLPEGMRERIKSAADANGRSMNAEILSRLEASLSGNRLGGTEELAEVMRAIFADLKEVRETDGFQEIVFRRPLDR